MTEFVYYFDRRMGIIVTDRQITIGNRQYTLSQVRGVSVAGQRSQGNLRMEAWLKVFSVLGLSGTFAAKLLISSQQTTVGVVSVCLLVLMASLVGILMLALAARQEPAITLDKWDGSTERLLLGDARRTRELAQAVRDAANDYQAGRSANNRGSAC